MLLRWCGGGGGGGRGGVAGRTFVVLQLFQVLQKKDVSGIRTRHIHITEWTCTINFRSSETVTKNDFRSSETGYIFSSIKWNHQNFCIRSSETTTDQVDQVKSLRVEQVKTFRFEQVKSFKFDQVIFSRKDCISLL